MSEDVSVTSWVTRLRNGDSIAAQDLWDRFFSRLISMTRSRIQSTSRAVTDEEDIVLSAMKSFCIGLQKGRFPELSTHESLWRLLLTITVRKIADKKSFDRRGKRDIAREISLDQHSLQSDGEIQAFISREPDPEFAVECAEQISVLMETLEHDDLRQVALLKMEGFTNPEIAQLRE